MSRPFASPRRSRRTRTPSRSDGSNVWGDGSNVWGDGGSRKGADEHIKTELDWWHAIRYRSQWHTLRQISGTVARPFGNVTYILAAFMDGKPDQPFIYIGESNNAVRRILQHWRILPGGARETRDYTTELFTVCTVSGFCPQTGRDAAEQRKYLALYLEYVLQHHRGDAHLLAHITRAYVNGRIRVPEFAAVTEFVSRIRRLDRLTKCMCWLHLVTCHPLFAPGPLCVTFHTEEFEVMYADAVSKCIGFVWDHSNAWSGSSSGLGVTTPAAPAVAVCVDSVPVDGGGVRADAAAAADPRAG